MELKIENFAKIKVANINVNGITVIAGKNNSGKSTIGKILFTLFHTFYQIDKKIERIKKTDFIENFEDSLLRDRNIVIYKGNSRREELNENSIHKSIVVRSISRKISNLFNENYEKTLNDLDEEIRNLILNFPSSPYHFNKDLVLKKYEEIILKPNGVSDEIILHDLLENSFNNNFKYQISNFNNSLDSKVSLKIKDESNFITFSSNSIKDFNLVTNFEHDAALIDDPLIVNKINSSLSNEFSINESSSDALLRNLALTKSNYETSIKSIKAKQKMEEVIKKIDEAVKGDLVIENNLLMLKENDNAKATSLINLSSGLKAFVLIKELIENEVINEKDVLILDEPEIHLHPEWQLLYAEIIVMLKKYYDLNIVITTHSIDFVEAIELYSQKYGVNDSCNFYVSKVEENMVEFIDLKDNPEEIYRQLVKSSFILDDLRSEIFKKEE